MKSRTRIIAAVLASIIACCLAAPTRIDASVSKHGIGGPFRALIVGGGPDIEHNQVAIESNVRYVTRLLPFGTWLRTLYTDGNAQSKIVLCQDSANKTYYTTPKISRIDGPSEPQHLKNELATISTDLSRNPMAPVLLYFTGHGSPSSDRRYVDNPNTRFDNNDYDMWDHKEFSVRDLASALKGYPKHAPIALVMVECFSGAFGNVLFEDGDPKADLADLNICGFFASVAQREAAGCTPEINEANYRDFTSYFFAALSGIDRLGKAVTGADYNHDGRVGMNEAFAYALIHDDSIDTPVCTSDVFLRRYVPAKDVDVLAAPFSQVQSWAAPAQLAALNGLSNYLDMSGEDRLSRAYDEFGRFMNRNPETTDPRSVHIIRFVRLAKSIILGHTLQASSDEVLKARFAALLKAESVNPLR
jgi:hypothetical protein